MKCKVKNDINRVGFELTPETKEEIQMCSTLSGCFFLGHWSPDHPGFWLIPEHKIREQDRQIKRQVDDYALRGHGGY